MSRSRRLVIAFATAAALLPAALPGTAARATPPPPEPDTPQSGHHRAPLDYDENECEGATADEGDVFAPPKTDTTGHPAGTHAQASHAQASHTPPPHTQPSHGRPAHHRVLPQKWPRNVPDTKEAVRMLGDLKVRTFNSRGYHRKYFGGSACWVRHGIDQCTTREVALKLQSVVPAKLDGRCKVVGGRWHSEYDNRDMADPAHVDIDHIVPLRQAWGAGARDWTDRKRREFANDLTASPQLVAVSTWSNRRKMDKGPDQWMPVAGAECNYSRAWIGVKDYYGLSVTGSEKAKLTQVLSGCRD
ncbi:DUF1524 domain-containing protein [Streptomyces klenkii]|uniref:GmrSD restriction endonuclease domain-containing protein n=1 Tax=Streptomyces klenkii TaxID=1420899 RepID=UPI0033A50609